MLKAENITKVYDKKEVLSNINLELEENKIYGLIGKNGVGKTTLLSIMSAQNKPTSGTVTINGDPVWENQKALERVCFSRELNNTTLFGVDTRKVKHILFAASVYFPHWDQEYANRLVKEFNLDVKKKVGKLSKGMLSMVTIIIGMASKAKITFLDEPVAGLDVFARDQFYKILLEEYSNSGRTFIVSTHIIEEMSNIFEEVIIINNGRLLIKQNTEDLVNDYCLISGKEEVVSEATRGYEIISNEMLGRNKQVCVKKKKENKFNEYDVDVDSVHLQKLFMYLTRE